MAEDVTVAVAVGKSTTGVEVLAKDDDVLAKDDDVPAGSPVILRNVIVVLSRVKLEIAQFEKLAEQVKS